MTFLRQIRQSSAIFFTIFSGLLLLSPLQAIAAAPAGQLVISELATGGASANEFIEIYNPTALSINVETLTLRLHFRDALGVETHKPLTVNTGRGLVTSGGFFLIAPVGSSFAAAADATYVGDGLVDNGSVYISTSATAQTSVLDKVGWGSQTSSLGYEGGPVINNPAASESLERRPGVAFEARGNGIDANINLSDFVVRVTVQPQSTQSVAELPQAPAAVTSFTASDTPNDQGASMTLAWIKSTDDGAGFDNVTGYAIWRKLGNEPQFPVTPIGSVGKGVVSFTDTTAATGASYVYMIESIDGAYSNFSALSAPVVATDNIGPIISVTGPAVGAIVPTVQPIYTGTITDPSGLANVTIFVDGVAVGTVTVQPGGAFSHTLSPITEGLHTVRILAWDPVGNSSENIRQITVDVTAPTVTLTVPSVTNRFFVDAVLAATDGISGVTHMQFSTDGIFDDEPWEAFVAQSSRSLAKRDGQQTIWARVRDGVGHVSSVAVANVTVAIPVTGAPANGLSSTVGNTITVTWEPVSGATTYLVKYSDGTTLYGPFLTSSTAMTIRDLDLSKTYRFEVASVNEAGHVSDFGPINAPSLTPESKAKIIPESKAKTATTGIAAPLLPTGGPETPPALTEEAPVAPVAAAPVQVLRATPSPSPSPTLLPSPTPKEDNEPEVLADTDDEDRDWPRVVIALSILIIAAGVATGAWYLYQWFIDRGTGSKGGRW